MGMLFKISLLFFEILRVLELLTSNNLTGELPATLAKLTTLIDLVIQGSGLSGPIPSGIASMTNLSDLILRSCNITDEIPIFVGTMTKLKVFYLTGNSLTGPLPPWMLKDGESIEVKVDDKGTTYDADGEPGGSSNFVQSKTNWAFSSTGHFLDEDRKIDSYIRDNNSRISGQNPQLYMNARLSPLSLTYYGFCLENGNYIVTLHFAEIMFADDRTYSSLGRRIFDVYVQGTRVLKDFNIEYEAGGVNKAIFRNFTAAVTANTVEIRLYWAGKGTTGIPDRGVYGPLISAISVKADLKGLDLHTGSFTLRQIKAATNNFDPANKIGEGGFGPVYKGFLSDGTIIAVKQLSSKSKQGNREFVNEIGMISALQHPHLVKLHGCCIEGNQLLLVYEYMENNSLARALFGNSERQA
ncbi:putative LRR receptor-like serine/threonine-protein kinase [Forsythia ovata]|uniref:non-specific serine/threonine protein kinase n=1 Tax=Forsythia ovata TaxID=205694 RepID=A0ABD1S717_9LAMI